MIPLASPFAKSSDYKIFKLIPMRIRSLLQLLFLTLPFLLAAQPKIQFVNWASGFDRPVDIAHCGDSRLFVVEQDGLIVVVDSLGIKIDTFLNIDPRVNSTNNEQGLLGLAFHPNYKVNGYFYVYYTKNTGGATQVSRFSVMPGNPNEADPNSEFSIFTTPQPYNNHNGGCIKFGPDGYLYIGLGDGGSGGDPQGYGQRKNTFLGKILRIDVNNSSPTNPYAVPSDNPFVGQSEYFPEIWSLGWRNPWRFSFDRLTGDMWIGDVGQVTREEVDFEPAGVGGRNYGWRCYEGTFPFNTTGCQPQNTYVGPVFDYDNNSMGCSITGGFIYRGSKYPDLYGVYLVADYCSGRIWGTKQNANGTFSTEQLANLGDYEFSSFGEDQHGELYVALLSTGRIQKITELCSPFQVSLVSLYSPVCHNSLSAIISLEPINGTGTITYSWSNGQSANQIVYLNPGVYTVTVTNGNGCSRVRSYEIEALNPDPPTLAVNDTILCQGQHAVLTVNGLLSPSQLRLYNGATLLQDITTIEPNYSYMVTAPGMYSVAVTDSLCTTGLDNINIELESALEPEVTVSGDTLFSTQPCTACQWLLNNQPIPGATNPFYVATESGVYELQVTSSQGCTYQSSGISIVISGTSLPASVRKFSLAPNPSNGLVMLEMELDAVEQFIISLSDTSQRQLFMQTHHADKLSLPIDLKSLPAGTYLLNVQMQDGSFVKKVVKR